MSTHGHGEEQLDMSSVGVDGERPGRRMGKVAKGGTLSCFMCRSTLNLSCAMHLLSHRHSCIHTHTRLHTTTVSHVHGHVDMYMYVTFEHAPTH